MRTTEAGGSATFTVALTAAPKTEMMISLASSNASEGTVSPATISLTRENWNIPVTVTIAGVDDDAADGNKAYTIHADGGAAGTADVMVTNDDDDSAGVTVTPTTGLVTTEAGGTATFTVVLDTRPSADVMVPIASADATEGTAVPASLTFTVNNWNAPQTVTVTGVNDALADGSQSYVVAVNPATSTDTVYAGIDAMNVMVTNIDNDSPGVIVTPTSGLVTSEAGATATFTVVLTSEPTANVSIALSSSDPGEGTVAPTPLTFTSANWNAPQTITVTGVDDNLDDGPQSYTVVVAPATSTDTGYAGVNPADVAVTNTDNDTAGFTVTPTSGLQTTEAGGTATFTVVLNTQPTANVTIAVLSSDLTEGTAAPATLTFTSANWDAPQPVTVTGVDDALADGNQPYTIALAPATSADTTYAGNDPADVSVTNIDNDTAGFLVTPTSGLQTTESAGQATFTVVLTAQPNGAVTIPVSSSATDEGTVSVTMLVFTTLDWNAPQQVTITGVDDAQADGNQPYTIVLGTATSSDPAYVGLDPTDVSVTNLDNDSAGFIVTPVAGLQTTEGGGTAAFTVVLLSQPTASVTIALSSSDISEGTVAPVALTFTSLNWNAPQGVTITGVDDAVADGNQPYTIITALAVSADPGYDGDDPANVVVTNLDNDSAGILVTPTAGLQTTEGGTTDTFTIVLLSEPTSNVTISLSSSNPNEGTASAALTFTTLNWDAPQTVTVTGVDDAVADGNQIFTILTAPAVSADPGYAGRNAADVTVTNLDNDSAGILVTPTSGLQTSEGGGTATFTVVLLSEPTANVTIGLSTSNSNEGTAAPTTLTFTSLNWNAPQVVTITGVNDLIADGNQPYTILTAAAVSADPGYLGLNASDVAVTNLDNDVAGILVVPTSGQTTEGGGTATFTVVLLSQPTANVTIPLSSSNTNEGTVSPAALTFTMLNWDAPQEVTATGVDDAVADGNQPYSIITAAAISSDAGYSGLDAADVSLTNVDNDSAGILVAPTSGLVTTETGGSASFNVVLTSQPLTNVAISVSSTRPGEGTASVTTLVFTPANFNAPQPVDVTGVDDAIADGNQAYTIVLGQAVSSDPSYAAINPPDVGVTNLDNDVPGVRVTPVSGLITSEGGTSDVFTVVLLSQPTADVTIIVSSGDPTEGSVVPTTLTFTPADYNIEKSVTVTGVNDAVADGNQPYQVVLMPVTSADPTYAGIDPSDVSVVNTDDDSPGFVIDPLDLLVSEFGDTDTFTISLTSQPVSDVTITLTSSNTNEGTVSPASVTFTPLNYNIAQTVTVTGVNDVIADGNQVFSIITGAATSLDPGYAGLNPADVVVTNFDNDVPNVFVKARRKLSTTEAGGTATIRVRLTTMPFASVTCTLSSSDLTEGQVSPQTLVFTAANFGQFQNVTVVGLDDAIVDGDQLYTVIFAACTSSDAGYNGIDPNDVAVINRDND